MWSVCITSDGIQIRHLGPDPEFGACISPRKLGVSKGHTVPVSGDKVGLLAAIKT